MEYGQAKMAITTHENKHAKNFMAEIIREESNYWRKKKSKKAKTALPKEEAVTKMLVPKAYR
jgi:hypothetical protein